jgi:hypothetical protein
MRIMKNLRRTPQKCLTRKGKVSKKLKRCLLKILGAFPCNENPLEHLATIVFLWLKTLQLSWISTTLTSLRSFRCNLKESTIMGLVWFFSSSSSYCNRSIAISTIRYWIRNKLRCLKSLYFTKKKDPL